MRLLLFVFLVGYAVRCDDSNNYYVIQMHDEDVTRQLRRPLKVYWNVPTMQCRSKKIPFEKLYDKFGIIQNDKDDFRGEKIAILYDPGLFPALLKNETSGKFVFRNGGVPQEGDLDKHLSSFRSVLEQSVTDPNFSGVGIIDFESWRPVFRQNFGVLVPYKDVSYEIEKSRHWWWPESWIQDESKQRFEEAARLFMENTLSLAKQMRPNAQWGYYGFPYCFNVASNNMAEPCDNKVPAENDRTFWLWSESTALYPSVYSSQQLTSAQLAQLVRGRVGEAARVRRTGTDILPYFWFRYRDGGFMSEVDLQTALQTFYKSEATGFIIWGSSNDVNTVDKCVKLLNYIEKVMGPAIAKYTKNNTKEVLNDDEYIPEKTEVTYNTTLAQILYVTNENMTTNNPLTVNNKNENTTTTTMATTRSQNEPDEEYDWTPPKNYTQDIQKYVEDEFNKPQHNNSMQKTKPKTVLNNLNDSLLIDMILDALFSKNNYTNDQNEADDKYEPKDEILTTMLVYNPPIETTDNYEIETSTYSGANSMLFNDNEESSTVDSNESDLKYESTTNPETTTYITENYEETTLGEDDYEQFHMQNTLFDTDDYIISDLDLEFKTEENYYKNIPTDATFNRKFTTTETYSTTETTNGNDYQQDITTEVSKTRIIKSTNGSEVLNAEIEVTTPSSADQVNGAASTKESKYYLCILFFYSVTKCLCDIFGQC